MTVRVRVIGKRREGEWIDPVRMENEVNLGADGSTLSLFLNLEFKGEGVKVEQPLVIPTGKPTLLRLGRREGKNIGLVIECVVIGPEGERREP